MLVSIRKYIIITLEKKHPDWGIKVYFTRKKYDKLQPEWENRKNLSGYEK